MGRYDDARNFFLVSPEYTSNLSLLTAASSQATVSTPGAYTISIPGLNSYLHNPRITSYATVNLTSLTGIQTAAITLIPSSFGTPYTGPNPTVVYAGGDNLIISNLPSLTAIRAAIISTSPIVLAPNIYLYTIQVNLSSDPYIGGGGYDPCRPPRTLTVDIPVVV